MWTKQKSDKLVSMKLLIYKNELIAVFLKMSKQKTAQNLCL